ncbi:hypothetical protein ACFVH7_40385 [Kitasatospora indigofera]|uniref:hypothetical protein n=1 Tax=Kitasatospora indigofera TaxID=67307 RepID=UPI00362C6848
MTALALREKVRAYNRRAELVRALDHLPPGPVLPDAENADEPGARDADVVK